jgi:aminopeptidase N
MAHELSHHWWGDWVTCETAEEMWINEGMAVYSEHTFLEQVYDYNTYLEAVKANHYDVLHRAHIDDSGFYALNAVPLTYTYGEHSYRKGADVMHTLRSYIGDANFFAGLQAIQTNYGGGHISSEEFRDEINLLAGVDVTDFFNDWILNPGFSQFSVTEMTASANGGNYDIALVIEQKLKGAPAYHSNVPFKLTFMDADWNTHEEAVNLSGASQALNFTIPINPVFVALNMDEKINQAVTAEDIIINSTGIKTLSYANATLNISQITDSTLLRVEHNWVAPSYNGGPANVVLSQDRYWTVKSIDLQNLEGTIKFYYNGQNSSSGDLDNSILTDWGTETFTEDSIVLLYRPHELAVWEEHTNYSQQMGSPFDKAGFLTALEMAEGQYAFGYKTNSSGINEEGNQEKQYDIYPNPADDTMNIDLTNWRKDSYSVEIYEISGKFIEKRTIKGGVINELSIQNLTSGMYLILLTDDNAKRYGSKRVVVK